jgi:hypothetical protein
MPATWVYAGYMETGTAPPVLEASQPVKYKFKNKRDSSANFMKITSSAETF